MIDIVSANDGLDLGVYDTEAMRAANILNTQLGSLEYAPTIGTDIDYFLTEPFQFQNESFQAYLVQVLANAGINSKDIIETVNALYSQYLINITGSENTTGFVAR
jgi:hypothetical protein